MKQEVAKNKIKSPLLIMLIVWALRVGAVGVFAVVTGVLSITVAYGAMSNEIIFLLQLGCLIIGLLAGTAVWLISNAVARMKAWAMYLAMLAFASCQYFLIMTLIYERHDYPNLAYLWWYVLGTVCFIGPIIYLWAIRKKFR